LHLYNQMSTLFTKQDEILYFLINKNV